MATVISGASGRRVYREVLHRVLLEGAPRAPRGRKTVDLGMTIIELDTAHDALPLGVGRNLSRAVAAVEALQLIGAFSEPQLAVRASARFDQFREPDGSFHGAYGVRIGHQIPAVLQKLRQDPDTRQAVVTLWDPLRDNLPDRRDYPCTVALNFTIEDYTLNLSVLMRSNDVWLGLPYDMFQFTQLQLTMAHSLRMRAGRYTHTTWSLHLYKDDIQSAQRMFLQGSIGVPIEPREVTPSGLGRVGMLFPNIMDRARVIADDDTTRHAEILPTVSERWYLEHVPR